MAPNEIEDIILDHPDKLVTDVVVAGVSHRSSRGGGRSAIAEKTPRAWIVLSESGRRRPAEDVITTLKIWTEDKLSKHKWVRGGFEIVREVSSMLL